MGEPVRIIDLARNMIRLAGYERRGDRDRDRRRAPGEKIHEELFNDGERSQQTSAERIVRAVRAKAPRSGVGRGDDRAPGVLVASGDEAGLAEHVVELMGTEGAAGRTLV